jgi:hypothetical protein
MNFGKETYVILIAKANCCPESCKASTYNEDIVIEHNYDITKYI